MEQFRRIWQRNFHQTCTGWSLPVEAMYGILTRSVSLIVEILILTLCDETCAMHWDSYNTCEDPFPSKCCPLGSVLVCVDLASKNSKEFANEIDPGIDVLTIANSNSSFVQNGDWRFLVGLKDLTELSFINNGNLTLEMFNATFIRDLVNLKTM